jgi:hypothetical protein
MLFQPHAAVATMSIHSFILHIALTIRHVGVFSLLAAAQYYQLTTFARSASRVLS